MGLDHARVENEDAARGEVVYPRYVPVCRFVGGAGRGAHCDGSRGNIGEPVGTIRSGDRLIGAAAGNDPYGYSWEWCVQVGVPDGPNDRAGGGGCGGEAELAEIDKVIGIEDGRDGKGCVAGQGEGNRLAAVGDAG